MFRRCGLGLKFAPLFLMLCLMPVLSQANTLGEQAFKRGDFEAALDFWKTEGRKARDSGDQASYFKYLILQAESQRALGQYTAAQQALQFVLKRLDSKSPTTQHIAIQTTLADVLSQQAKNAKADVVIKTAVDNATLLGDKRLLAAALNTQATLFARQKQYTKAQPIYQKTADLAIALNDRQLATKANLNIARISSDNKDYKTAGSALTKALQTIDDLPASHDKAYMLINAARLASALSENVSSNSGGWLKTSFENLNKANTLANQIDDVRSASYALGYLGELYYKAQRYDESLRLTQQAIFKAQNANAPEILYRWQWQAGQALRDKNDITAAIDFYRRAVYTLKDIRADLNNSSRANNFRTSIGPIYFELADLLLRQKDSDPKKLESQLIEARETVEQLKAAELQDYFQDSCVTALQSKITGLDKVDAKTAVLYPILLEDRAELLLSLSTGIKQFTIPIKKSVMVKEIRRFRQRLEKRTTHQYLRHARKLYKWLITPMEATLTENNINTMVIVPDGALRTIPLSALHDGKKFLIEKYAIATTPGLALTDPKPLKRKNLSLLLNGLTEAVQDFPALPNVQNELDSISKLYKGRVLKDEKFILNSVTEELTEKPYRVVHIASHGQFVNDVRKSFLLTYDNKLTMDGLENIIGASKFRDEPIELLTLSACQTAAGDDRAALGLAGIAIKAGARSALASLWFINDQASSNLVSDFYKYIKGSDVSKARALQQAQMEMIDNRRYRHPSYWSPFLLIGNWL